MYRMAEKGSRSHDGRVADANHRVHDQAAGTAKTTDFDRVKRALVEVNGAGRIRADKMRGHAVHTIGDGFTLRHTVLLSVDDVGLGSRLRCMTIAP